MIDHHHKHFSILKNTSRTIINILTDILHIQSFNFKIWLICNLTPVNYFSKSATSYTMLFFKKKKHKM